jgi:hypothetical protein
VDLDLAADRALLVVEIVVLGEDIVCAGAFLAFGN